MNRLAKHMIGGGGQEQSLVEWVKHHKYRNYPETNADWEAAWLRKIVAITDNDDRESMVSLLNRAVEFNNKLVETHKELDTIGRALQSIVDGEAPQEA